MTNAVAAATLTAQSFPAGTVAGNVVFTLMDSSGNPVGSPQSIPSGASDTDATATFTSVAAGTGYTVTAVRQDGSGNPLAPAVASPPFDIAVSTTVSVSVPSAVGVTVQ